VWQALLLYTICVGSIALLSGVHMVAGFVRFAKLSPLLLGIVHYAFILV
jgi:hypothetical protein